MPALATVSETRTVTAIPVLETLLIDDSEFDRVRIRRLSDASVVPMNLTEVSSIAEMSETVKELRFDLILIDYHLGDGDGLEAMRLLRQAPLQEDAGIIMITGNERVDVAASAFRDGCDDFIAKSAISAEVFNDTVERVLTSLRKRQAAKVDAEHLRAEIRGAVVASLRGKEVQTMIAEAIGIVEPDHPIAGYPPAAGFQHVVAIEDTDEFRFI